MSSDDRAREEERLEDRRNFQRDQQRIQQAFNSDGEVSRNYLNELLDNEELTTGEPGTLQTVTVAKIQNLLTRDWVLANLTDAQEHDIRFKLEVIKIKVLGMHPPEDSVITGAIRAFLFDDEMEELHPLSSQERILIDDLFETLKARATRGRGGFERQQLNTSIAESRTQDNREDESGGLVGLFS